LEENGLPKAMARWCTRAYKLQPSENFFKAYELDGLNQIIGLTRFQGNRLEKNPFPTLWDKVKQDRSYHVMGSEEDPPKLPDTDEEGFPFEYDVTYKEGYKGDGAWHVKSSGSHPDFKIYQTLPIFDSTDDWQVKKMAEYGVNINPIITNFDFHGCLLCPNRGPEYFQCLKDRNRELYDIADGMRKAGSARRLDRGEGEYWYHFNPAKGSMEEQADKYPQKFTTDDAGNLRPIM
jgi:3'-phosphoadenosine 5'-phosphosulfate sulfotransferase (PAPS reductase)/FAD synthetase